MKTLDWRLSRASKRGGCRSTIEVRDGAITREAWWTEFGNSVERVGLLLRSSSEQPGYGKSKRETTKLSLGEPDAAIFQPPKSYTVKTVEMDEVPCIEESKPKISTTASN
jgi:hypothetical protein